VKQYNHIMKKDVDKDKEDEEPLKFYDSKLIVYGIAILLVFTLICFIPKWLIQPAGNSKLDFSRSGEIGDTIGGIMGPFVAICAAILTFLAFWIQFKANQQQARQFKIQARDARIDRFENRLSDLIKIHRDNLNEIEIDDFTGRKAFIPMFQELKYIYFCVKEFFIHSYDNEILLDIAYRIFYLGTADTSLILIHQSLKDKLPTQEIKGLLSHLQRHKDLDKTNTLITLETEGLTRQFILEYEPFEGHISKLGHYFRHLYYTIKFIDSQKESFLDEEEKYEYAKTVRAQLSDYEQLLLFYDICSAFGKSWISKGFIRSYRMIKNLPLPLADFGRTPEAIFENDIKYWAGRGKYFFEWKDKNWS